MRALAILIALTFSPVHADAREFKLATWNLGWLTLRPPGDRALPANVRPYDPADLARLRRYAERLHADVIAIQGVDGAQAAAAVFDPAEYDVRLTGDDVVLRSGVAVRRGLSVRANPDLDALAPDGHLRSGADVTVDLAAGVALRVLSVQLKSGCRVLPLDVPGGDPACAVLRAQGRVVGAWLAQPGPAVAMGDLGRVLDAGGETAALLGGDPARVTAGHANPCWGGGAFTDHALLTGAAAQWIVPNSLRVMVYAETDAIARAHLPGHCPVSFRLRIPD